MNADESLGGLVLQGSRDGVYFIHVEVGVLVFLLHGFFVDWEEDFGVLAGAVVEGAVLSFGHAAFEFLEFVSVGVFLEVEELG